MIQTRFRHITDESTVQALATALRRARTLRQLSADLGEPTFSIATLSEVLRRIPGALSAEGEQELRSRLGIQKTPRTRRRYLRPCLDTEPGRRIDQLWILVGQAEAELLAQGREP